MYQSFNLDSGLRVILAPSATDVVYAGIAVATGTRHELDSESGMAHLVEHMTFKGTQRLTSMQILNRMESVGGDLNAYTGKEETIYYATFLRQHLKRAIPLLLDIVFNSTFPQEELDKEVEVVIDEIESYNDSPAELIYDDFEALLFPNHPLGRSILGNANRLRQYRTSDLQAFARRTYSPERAVLFVKGNVTEKEVKTLSPLPRPSLVRRGVITFENEIADPYKGGAGGWVRYIKEARPPGPCHARFAWLCRHGPALLRSLPAEQPAGRSSHELPPQSRPARAHRSRLYRGKQPHRLHRHRRVVCLFRL